MIWFLWSSIVPSLDQKYVVVIFLAQECLMSRSFFTIYLILTRLPQIRYPKIVKDIRSLPFRSSTLAHIQGLPRGTSLTIHGILSSQS